MNDELLRKTLDELHQELEQSSSLDTATRDRLRQTVVDIQEVLDRNPTRPAAETDLHASALQDRIRDFETTHPRLAYTIGRVIDLLARTGI